MAQTQSRWMDSLGLAQDSHPVILELLIDASISADTNRHDVLQSFGRYLNNRNLPGGSRVLILPFGATSTRDSEFIVNESGGGLARARARLEAICGQIDARKIASAKQSGTNLTSAFDLGNAYWAKAFKNSTPDTRVIVVCWSDMIADPTKANGRVTRYKQAADYLWPKAAKGKVQLALFGVDPQVEQRIESRWTNQVLAIHTFGAEHKMIEAKDLFFTAVGDL